MGAGSISCQLRTRQGREYGESRHKAGHPFLREGWKRGSLKGSRDSHFRNGSPQGVAGHNASYAARSWPVIVGLRRLPSPVQEVVRCRGGIVCQDLATYPSCMAMLFAASSKGLSTGDRKYRVP